MNGPKKILTVRERVAHNLRAWRLQREISQTDLSASADISQTFLSQVENGLRNVSIDTLEKLAAALEIDILDLFATQALAPDVLTTTKNAHK